MVKDSDKREVFTNKECSNGDEELDVEVEED